MREGSEIIIEVKTSALFLVTQKIYRSREGVVLTPDLVPASTFLKAYYNRPGGSELWVNPRGSRQSQPRLQAGVPPRVLHLPMLLLPA